MIPFYKTILYATDLSSTAAHPFRHAVAMARRFRAKVHVLHVLPEVEPAVLNYIATVMGQERLTDLELEHKEEVLDRIRMQLHQFAKLELADHPEDVERIATIEVRHGHPVARILEKADQIGADLILLGSHGKGRLKYAFLGSVVEKVLRKSHRPVLVIPPESRGAIRSRQKRDKLCPMGFPRGSRPLAEPVSRETECQGGSDESCHGEKPG